MDLSPEVPGDESVETRFEFAGATESGRRVVFESDGRRLTPDGLSNAGVGVYEWANGEVRFVSKLPSGEPADAALAGAGSLRGQFYPGDHLISEDGSRIFFTAAIGVGGPLYVREDGISTELLTASERAGDDPSLPASGLFAAAKADDGALALFTSAQKLTDDATACDVSCPGGFAPDLYLWDAEAPAGERLTDLTTGDEGGGGVQGVAAAADDLSHVYFVAAGVLAPGAQAARPNLYKWSPGEGVRYIATLTDSDGGVWATERDARTKQFRDARISANGAQLLFVSHGRLTAADNAGTKQVYLYDAETDRLACVSCAPEPAASGDAWLFYPPDLGSNPAIESPRAPYRLPRNLSSDGKRAFFETAQSLVPTDTNGKVDVYQWAAGAVSLISTGKSAEGARFIDAGADGGDVFFTTRERLVGADVDDQVDVYDARVDGGFPEQELPPPCVGDECQGPFALPPSLAAGSSPAGADDAQRLERASLSVRRFGRSAQRALAAGRRVVLLAHTSKAGRVVIRGRARVGRRTLTALRASKSARRGGPVRVSLRLSRPARLALARSGRLRVSLVVRFGDARPAVMGLELKAAGTGRGSR